MFGFFKKKAEEGKTLEQLVNEFAHLRVELQEQRQEHQRQREQWEKELEEERRLKQEALDKLRQQEANANIIIHFYPGKELFVVLDGNMIHAQDPTQEVYDQLVQLREAKDVAGIKKLLIPEVVQQQEETKTDREIQLEKNLAKPAPSLSNDAEEDDLINVLESVHILVKETDEFEIKGNSVFMKGVDRSIPKTLIEDLARFHAEGKKEQYESVKNFWFWIVLNYNNKATEDFYSLVQKYKPTFTKEGFILAYRWVQSVAQKGGRTKSSELVEFVSNQWAKVKAAKKGPKNFSVVLEDNQFKLIKGNEAGDKQVMQGNLADLYTSSSTLVPEQTYTDGYTKKMDIRIGKEVRMNRKDCDESEASCSRGLHSCFKLSDHNGNGDTKLLVAVCPKDIVSAPYNTSKFRSCSYLPLAVLKGNETEQDFLKKGEGLNLLEDYFKFKSEELEKLAKSNTVAELTRQHLIPQSFSKKTEGEVKEEVNTVLEKLHEVEVDLKNRIQPVK